MAPPVPTSTLELSATNQNNAAIITTPPTIIHYNALIGKAENTAVDLSTVNGDEACGWKADATAEVPVICPSPSQCVTNTRNIVGCSAKDQSIAFNTACWDDTSINAPCDKPDNLCCTAGAEPAWCITYLWFAPPARSRVFCDTSPFQGTTYFIEDFSGQLHGTTSHTSTSLSSTNGHPISTKNSEPSNSSPASSDGETSSGSESNKVTIPSPGSTLTTSHTTTSTGISAIPGAPPADSSSSSGLSTAAKAGIGTGSAVGVLILLSLVAFYLLFKKRRAAHEGTHYPRAPNNSHGLQDHPAGTLPAEVGPPARHLRRTSSTGWRSTRSQTESDLDAGTGASEVPVDMRGRAPGAVELHASPVVEMAPIGVGQSQYDAYGQARPPRAAVELEGSSAVGATTPSLVPDQRQYHVHRAHGRAPSLIPGRGRRGQS